MRVARPRRGRRARGVEDRHAVGQRRGRVDGEMHGDRGRRVLGEEHLRQPELIPIHHAQRRRCVRWRGGKRQDGGDGLPRAHL